LINGMPISYQKGNIFESQKGLTVIAHQCNCRGSFGAGIAREVARRFPEVDRAQREWYRAGKQQLGIVQLLKTHTGLVIANLYAQDGWRRVLGRPNTDYDALGQCLATLRDGLSAQDVLGMPKIGAGLGGGDWAVIETIIEDVFRERTVYVYVL